VATTQGHPLEITVGEKKPIVYNIRLSDEPFALIGDERISLAEARLTGVIEYVELQNPGQAVSGLRPLPFHSMGMVEIPRRCEVRI
jgi:hypothetical protein